jgi:nucleoside-diphosphate-sugar epimerase
MIQNVLVTGASGFVGSHVVRELNRRGLRPFALMRTSSSAGGLEGTEYQVRNGSLGDVESLRQAVHGMDAVIHVAGVVAAPSRELFIEHNASGTRRILEAIASETPSLKRFLYVSSLAASGPTLDGSLRKESDEPRIVSAYGESKRVGENHVQEFASRFPCLIVRPPLVYGPRDRGVLTIAQTAAKGWMALLPSEPPVVSKRYSQIYGEDLARGIVEMTLSQASGWSSGDAFFLAGREVVTQEQIFETMAAAIDRKLTRVSVPGWAIRGAAYGLSGVSALTGKSFPLNPDKLGELFAPAWTCSPDRAREVFGFEAMTPFADGIQATMKWYSEQGWL